MQCREVEYEIRDSTLTGCRTCRLRHTLSMRVVVRSAGVGERQYTQKMSPCRDRVVESASRDPVLPLPRSARCKSRRL